MRLQVEPVIEYLHMTLAIRSEHWPVVLSSFTYWGEAPESYFGLSNLNRKRRSCVRLGEGLKRFNICSLCLEGGIGLGESSTFKCVVEDGDELLGHCEREDQLGPNHQNLGGQSLEESTNALVADHVADDGHA